MEWLFWQLAVFVPQQTSTSSFGSSYKFLPAADISPAFCCWLPCQPFLLWGRTVFPGHIVPKRTLDTLSSKMNFVYSICKCPTIIPAVHILIANKSNVLPILWVQFSSFSYSGFRMLLNMWKLRTAAGKLTALKTIFTIWTVVRQQCENLPCLRALLFQRLVRNVSLTSQRMTVTSQEILIGAFALYC